MGWRLCSDRDTAAKEPPVMVACERDVAPLMLNCRSMLNLQRDLH